MSKCEDHHHEFRGKPVLQRGAAPMYPAPRTLFRVDFIVVLESATSLMLKAFRTTSALDISALRALRVLRPLRAITYIPQVGAAFSSLRYRTALNATFYVGCKMCLDQPGWFHAALQKVLGTSYTHTIGALIFCPVLEEGTRCRQQAWLPIPPVGHYHNLTCVDISWVRVGCEDTGNFSAILTCPRPPPRIPSDHDSHSSVVFVPTTKVKLLFETVISAFKVVNTLLLCVGFVILFFGNVG